MNLTKESGKSSKLFPPASQKKFQKPLDNFQVKLYNQITKSKKENKFKMSKVNNFPTYAAQYKYIVTRLYNGEHWFWGAYNDYFKAEQVVEEIGGYVQVSERP